MWKFIVLHLLQLEKLNMQMCKKTEVPTKKPRENLNSAF